MAPTRSNARLMPVLGILACLGWIAPRGQAQNTIPNFVLSGAASDILILLDTSQTMNANVPLGSAGATRYEVVQRVLEDMVASNPDVRWGLVTNSDVYYVGCQTGTTRIRLGQYARGTATTEAFEEVLGSKDSPGLTCSGDKDLDGGLWASLLEWDRAIRADDDRLCRKKAMIIITGAQGDTVPCYSLDAVSLVDYIYRYAPYAGGTGKIPIYVVGFDLQADSHYYEYDDMAEAGQGEPYYRTVNHTDVEPYVATNKGEFKAALARVLNDIVNGTYTGTAPVLSPDAKNLYQAFFEILPEENALAWQGHILDHPLDVNDGSVGSARMDVADWLTTVAPTDRHVYTSTDSSGGVQSSLSFSPANAGLLLPWLELSTALDGTGDNVDCDLGPHPGTALDSEALIRFILGDTSQYYQDCNTPREAWKLFDVFHATPRLVGPPSAPSLDLDYQAFRTELEQRPDMLVVGSNGGMLHAFRVAENGDSGRTPSDGAELWGYIPHHLLPRLKDLWEMEPHPLFVDATATIRDVKVTEPGGSSSPAWRTVAVFGNGVEGDETACDVASPTDSRCGFYTAVDISGRSETSTPVSPLWEFAGDGDIISAAAEPAVAKIRVQKTDGTGDAVRTVAFLPGIGRIDALSPTSPIYIVDVGTGARIGKIGLPWHNDDPLTSHGVRSRPLVLDTTNDMLVDRLYVGDMEGYFWRVDLSASDPSSWSSSASMTVLFDPYAEGATGLPITYPATAVYTSSDDLLVYFGTGDPTTTHAGLPAGAFYALWDSGSDEVAPRLLDSADGNWPIALATNEVLAGEPVVLNGILYFTTYYPSPSECYMGFGRLYAVSYQTAAGRFGGSTDGSTDSAYVELGSGVPSSVVLGADRWYVAMNNGTVGEGDTGGIISETGQNPNQFLTRLRTYAWLEGEE